MKIMKLRAVIILLASLGGAGCATNHKMELSSHEQSVEAAASEVAAVEAKDLPASDSSAPETGDLLAKARAIAAAKGLGGSEDEARARATLAPMAGGGAPAAGGAAGSAASNSASDPQAIFQRAAMRFAAQGGGDKPSYTSNVMKAERLDANDPREIFRKAQALARDRALSDARAFGGLADSRAFGAGAQTQAQATNPQTYFVEAMRLRQQQSALALGALAQ
jgi:hypothetical protein